LSSWPRLVREDDLVVNQRSLPPAPARTVEAAHPPALGAAPSAAETVGGLTTDLDNVSSIADKNEANFERVQTELRP